ncbi:hypothetical protein ACYPKM_05240 [Pseudomonas aeruginosa]
MLAPVRVGLSLKMRCGHEEAHNISYNGRRQRENELRGIKEWACRDCRRQMEDWLKMQGLEEPPYPISFRPLRGSDPKIKWADSIRRKVHHDFGPLMTLLAKREDPLAHNLWRALYLMMAPVGSDYWIDQRNHFSNIGVHMWSIFADVAWLYQPPFASERISKNSAYGIMRDVNPQAIIRLKEYNPGDGLDGKPFQL